MTRTVHMFGVDDQQPRRRLAAPSGRPVLRWIGHVAFLLAWIVIALMGAVMWGPHFTKYRTDIIVGQSMEPTIPLYSVIVVEPVPPSEIRRGDVITFEQPDVPGRKVTHRVVGTKRTADGPVFQTRGDNNPADDPYVVHYDTTGYRLVHHVPHLGWVMLQAQTKWARILLVVLPVLLVLVTFLRWMWRDEDDDDLDDEHGYEYEEGHDHASDRFSTGVA